MAVMKQARKKKKTAKKKTTAKKRTAVKPAKIKYSCVDGKCKPQPKTAHLKKKGNTVEMRAVGTDVHITFTAGSPFAVSHIDIPAGTTQTETVVASSGTFIYDLRCDACPPKGPKSAAPPQMIVP